MNDGSVWHPQQAYFERIAGRLEPGMRWLDVGCGHTLVPSWLPNGCQLEQRLLARAGCLIGLDSDAAALRRNRTCSRRLVGTATALPLAAASVDLVTSNMLFEHLPRPRPALSEVRRVMRPGGRLIIHTPNALDLGSLAARVIPNRWHPPLVARFEGRDEAEVYPTYYAFNDRATIVRLLDAAGFRSVRVEYLDQPDSFGRVPILGTVEALWHRLARRVPRLRGTLLVEAEAC